ncbi:MAG: LPS-assembly protein LptD, partial [Candidatus Zixiibacteriota bacterium]
MRLSYILLLFGTFLMFISSIFAQERKFKKPLPKSTTDTAEISEMSSAQKSTELDTVIDYGAQNMESTVDNRITYLMGDAWIKYRNMTLRAAKITIEWNKNLLIAEGVSDTIWSHAENPGDSTMQVVYRGTPEFSEGGDVITGFKMVYNFKTKKARVEKGRTKFEGGFYFGERIKKVGEKILNVRDGYFTTCDLEDPHFHFQSKRMKITLQDKVIAKPVVLYIGKVPVAALPFGIFPNKSGRHSGLIIPRYGESALEGRYLRELGYYFAPSDYWDARFMVDFFEKAGFLFRGDVNYAVRYKLRGALSSSLTRKNFTSGRATRRWDLRIRHRQQLSPTMNLDVNGQFVSDNSFYRDLSSNRQQRLMQQLNSNATISKTWPGTQNSL